MPNSRIVPKNDWDDAELTASAAAESGFDVENTQNTIRDKTWRTTSNATQSITGVWASNRTVSHFSLHRHLCHEGNVRLQLYSDAAASVQVYDSGTVSATPYTVSGLYTWSQGSSDPLKELAPYWLWFAETSARSFKVTFSGTTGDFYQVSRAWIGRYWEPARSPTFGMTLGHKDNTDAVRTQGGSLRTNAGEIWRYLSMDFNGINEVELETWNDIRVYAGTSKDVMVSVFPGNGTRKEALHTLAGRFSNLNDIGRPSQVISMRVQLEEN
jgi:hypothetical protein